MRVGKARIDLDGFLEYRCGGLQVFLMLIDQPEVKIGPGEIGMQLNGFFQVGDGLIGLLQAGKRDDPQKMMRGCKTGKHVQGLLQGFGGLLEFLFVRVIRALVEQVLGFIRRQARERTGEA